MDFKSALTKVCQDFSKEIIFQKRIISILDDYMAFKDVPYYKIFYKTILNIGDLRQLISQNHNERTKAIYTFLAISGLDETKVKSFLTLVSECYFRESHPPIQPDNFTRTNNRNIHSHEVEQFNCGKKESNPSNGINSHIIFLGKELGCSVSDMSNYLISRGFNHTGFSYDGTRAEYSGYYLGFPNSVISIWATPRSKIVWRIEIRLKTDIKTITEIYRKKYFFDSSATIPGFICKLHSGSIHIYNNLLETTIIEYEDKESFKIRQLENNEQKFLKEQLDQQETNRIINRVNLDDI